VDVTAEEALVEMTVHREVAASRARVWSVITDLERAPIVLSGVARIERLDGGEGFGVGTRWRETRTVFGRESTEESRVTAVEPGQGYTTVATSGGTTYTSVLRLEPAGDDRCRLSMSFGAEPSGRLGRILSATLGRAFQGPTRRMLERDLQDIATAAETRGPDT
jgi:carbon monoxide dehydrogenase subunit G